MPVRPSGREGVDGTYSELQTPMTSGAVLDLVPRLVTPWQRPTPSALLDAPPRSGEEPTTTTGRLEVAVAPDVLARALVGDDAAQRMLFDAYAARVYGLAYRMVGDRSAAEDITQDVFARVFDRLHQFRGDAPFGAWLHRVAVTTILNAIRKSRSVVAREAPLDDARYAEARTSRIEPDVRDRVRKALASLPAGLRMVVIMFDIEGYTHDDIAEALGITSGASRVRLSRARDTLRSVLAIDAEEWSA